MAGGTIYLFVQAEVWKCVRQKLRDAGLIADIECDGRCRLSCQHDAERHYVVSDADASFVDDGVLLAEAPAEDSFSER